MSCAALLTLTPLAGSLLAPLSAASVAPLSVASDVLHSPITSLLLFVVGVCFGAINTLAGGASVLSLPALLLLGLPPHAANATNRVPGITQTLSALWSFKRKGTLRGLPVLMILIIAPLGGTLGARLSLLLTQAQMNVCIQVCLAAIAAFTLLAPKRLFNDEPLPALSLPWQIFWGCVASLYGGFLQAGIGLVSLYYIRFACGYDLVRATALKVVFIAGLTLPSLATFIYYGQVKWLSALALSVGALLGAQLGVHLSLKPSGALIIRRALPFAALLMVIKLGVSSF